MSVIDNTTIQSKLIEATASRNRSPILSEAQVQQANTLVKNFASNGATLGDTVSGFKSLMEQVRPVLEERGEELRKLAEPVISEMTENVPGVTVTSKPTTKSNVDTLAGTSTAAEKKLRKVISSGNPKAINEVLRNELEAAEPAIKQATNEASNAVNDPKVQEQLKGIGFTDDALADFNSLLSSGGVNKLMSNIETEKISAGLARASTLEMRALGNPFGADASTIGPKGVNNGNILGSVGGLAANTGPFKGVGTPLEAIKGSIDPITGLDVKPLIDFGGNTNLATSVGKGERLSLDGPTTTVFEVTSKLNIPQSITDFTYEKVNSSKEFELEIGQVNRDIKIMHIGWLGSATGSDTNWTAKEWNEKVIQANRAADANTSISTAAWQCHYFIRKDGVVERVLPIGMRPYQNEDDYDLLWKESIIITLDAGFKTTQAEGTFADLTSDSITAAQWKSIDMMLKVFLRHPTSLVVRGMQDGTEEDVTLGPGFDVRTYAQKFRKTDKIDITEPGSPAAETISRLKESTKDVDSVTYDEQRREFVANVNDKLKGFASISEAIANTRI